LKRVNDKQTTGDITQQVFLKALTNIKKYVHKGLPYSAYLYRIATNECNSLFRDNSRTRFVVIEEGFSEDLVDELGL
ncbi:RNA polymerase sigma factor, partial [Xanthovirga aplysinae]|uniref:RNA polymerase sigma factor n=1 Tax=Xanthovirga aplysinae TaxID=2529853 RepID=UPI0024834630